MIESIIRYSVQQRGLVLLLTALLLGAGVFSVKNTPLDAIPDLSDVQVIIKTSYPGQAPQLVQDQVTYPLTTAMLSVPGAKTVRGFSFFGDSYIYVIFEEGTDLYWARSRVLEYLSQVSGSLPAAAKPELGPDATGVGWVYLYALRDLTGKHDLSQLKSLQDWFLKYELQTVPGVSEVSSLGGMVKQYQVTLQPQKLRAYSLPVSLIQAAIEQANQETGASVVELAEAEYMVRATGYLQGLADLENVPLGVNVDGQPLLLKHVANVALGPQSRRGIAELNGNGETVGGIVVMRFGENAKNTIDGVKQRLAQLQKSLPDGVEVVTVYDRSGLIESAVDNLWQKLLEEFAIVALVCFVFLFHFRSSLVAIISLPVGVLTAFWIMSLQGLNANIMSLGGIAIAIGAMVDGAIVMIENMHKHMERQEVNDHNRWQVVVQSATEVGPALFFSLLIITVSFLPVFTLEAQEGRMFSPLAYTKTYAMAVSAGLAITLIPVLMGYFVRGRILAEDRNPLNRLLVAIYRPVLTKALAFPKFTLMLALLLTASSIYPLQRIGSEFMPTLDEGDLMYMPSTFAGISVGKARELLQQTDKLIKSVPEVKTVFGKIGRAETATDPAPLTMIETYIQFKPQSEWRPGMTKAKIREQLELQLQLPGISNAWVMPIKTRIDMLSTGIKTPLGLKVAGPDLTIIQDIGRRLEQLLVELPGTTSAYAERVVGGRYLKVDIDRLKAARHQLTVAQVQGIISTAVGGANISETVEGQERYPINLRYPQSYRDSPEALARLPIVTPHGEQLSLGDVATILIDDGPPSIRSENARLNGWVYIDIEEVDVADYVALAQTQIDEKLNLPAGYSLQWAGQYQYLQRAQQKLSYVVPLTLAIIIVLLYLCFGRLREVLMILLTLPLAMTGSLWLMYAMGFKFSVAAGVGFIALAGVAVEVGVIMLVYLNQACSGAASVSGMAFREQVLEGASLRLRPVMMTSVSIVLGLIPILVGSGTGSELMSRIAAPMVGGMVSAAVLTLLVLPVVYFLNRPAELNPEQAACR